MDEEPFNTDYCRCHSHCPFHSGVAQWTNVLQYHLSGGYCIGIYIQICDIQTGD